MNWTLYNAQCTLYKVQHTMHNVQCALCIVPCTMCIVPCTMCIVQCTMYNAQCTMCIVHCNLWKSYFICPLFIYLLNIVKLEKIKQDGEEKNKKKKEKKCKKEELFHYLQNSGSRRGKLLFSPVIQCFKVILFLCHTVFQGNIIPLSYSVPR